MFAARNEERANCAGVLLTFSLEQYIPSELRPIDRWYNNNHKKHNSFHSHVVWRAKRRGRRADAAAAAARNAKRQILVAVVATTGLIVVKEERLLVWTSQELVSPEGHMESHQSEVL